MRLHTCAHLALAVVLAVGCDRPTPLPDLAVSSERLEFVAPPGTADPAPQTLYVTNPGEGALARPELSVSYAGVASGWLSAEVAPGEGAPYRVTVRATVGALPPGTYEASLTVSAANAGRSPVQVPVTLVVPPPGYALSVSSLEFVAPGLGGNPAPQVVTITNQGRGTLPVPQASVSYVGSPGWLEVEVGGMPGEYTLTVRASAVGLASATYGATVALSGHGVSGTSPTLAVSFVVPAPAVGVIPVELTIDGIRSDELDPEPVDVEVVNLGGGLLPRPTAISTVAPGGPAWLHAEVVGESPPYRLRVRVREQLPDPPVPGEHLGTVVLEAPDAGTATLTVRFRMPRTSVHALTTHVYYVACAPLPETHVRIQQGGPAPVPKPTAIVAPDDAGWLEAHVAGDRPPWILGITPKAPPARSGQSATVRLEAPGADPGTATFEFWEKPRSEVVTIDPYPVAFFTQRGLGDPGQAWFRAGYENDCSPIPEVSVSYLDGPRGWLALERRPAGHLHEYVLRASSPGLTPDQSARAWLDVAFPGAPVKSVSVFVLENDLRAGTMERARTGHALTVMENRSVVVSGGDDGTAATSSTEGVTTFGWGYLYSMTAPRTRHATTTRFGQIWAVGGSSDKAGAHPLRTIELRFQDGRWASLYSLLRPRLDPALAWVGNALSQDRLLVASGEGPPEIVDHDVSVEAFPGGGPAFTSLVTLEDGRVLAAGGTSPLAAIYDPAHDEWRFTGPLGETRARPALELLSDGRVLAIGGHPGARSAELWDPATGTWSPAGEPLAEHASGETVTLRNGKVLAFGGWTDGGESMTADVEAYDPATDTWSVVATLPSPRVGVRAARTDTGEVVVAGGTLQDGQPSAELFRW